MKAPFTDKALWGWYFPLSGFVRILSTLLWNGKKMEKSWLCLDLVRVTTNNEIAAGAPKPADV